MNQIDIYIQNLQKFHYSSYHKYIKNKRYIKLLFHINVHKSKRYIRYDKKKYPNQILLFKSQTIVVKY